MACRGHKEAENGLGHWLYSPTLSLPWGSAGHTFLPPSYPLQCPTAESHLLNLVPRPFDICFCAMLYSLLPTYAKNSRAGKCQFPLHPKSSHDLVPMSGLCLPPRTVSFSSADQILLTTNSVLSSSDVFLDSPHHMVSYPLPSLPPPTPTGDLCCHSTGFYLKCHPSTAVHVSGPC